MTLLDDAAEENFNPEVANIEIIPSSYVKDNNGIYKIDYKKHKDGEIEKIIIPISYTPFVISQRLENPDNKEVSFKISFDGTDITISAGDLSNKKGIVKMALHGINTIESHAKSLTAYIMEMRNLNNIPVAKIYDRFGWKEDGSFVLGKTRYTKEGNSEVSLTLSGKQTEAVHQKGSLKGWINTISGLMKYDSQRFKMYAGTAAPLLKVIDEQNLCLNDFGDTSLGKTVTTLCSTSMYGEPYDLCFSGDSTKVGMERMVTTFCDMPINLDDAQNIDQKLLTIIIYMLVNGVGKIRGAKEGGTQEVLSWRTSGLFTSEVPLLTDEAKGGLGARLMEVSKGLGKQDEAAVSLFERDIKNHHGVFAPLLISYILNHEKEIIQMHDESKKTLNMERGKYAFDNAASGIAGRLANVYATVLTAGKVFENLYKSIGGEYKDPEPIVIEIFQKNIQKQGAETYTSRGLNHILSWIAANRSNFLENGERDKDIEGKAHRYKIYGDITNTNYFLNPNELRAELDRAKFSFERLIEDFKEAGYLTTDKGKKQKTHWMEGNPTKTYALIREKVDIKDADSGNGGKHDSK